MRRTRHNMASAIALAATLLTGSPLLASGQTSAGAQSIGWRDLLVDPIRAQNLTYVDANGAPKQPGTSYAELLRGNGTRAGYMLAHGGIVPGTVSVSVGARTLRANVEYFLDYANGMLAFAEPVRQFDTIRASYQYVGGMDAARSLSGVSGLTLNFAKTSLNLAYGISNNGSGLNFNTYGLGLNTAVAKGLNLSSLMYFSNPASSNQNLALSTTTNAAPTRAANAGSAKADHLMVQNLNYAAGNTRFRATYQDIGTQFSGFQSMRQNNAKDANALAQIAALEKERGIKRLGFGAGFGGPKGGALSFDWDQIKDASGGITKQAIGYTSKAFHFNFASQSVGSTFNSFGNLRDATAAQWAIERGIRRNDLSLGLLAGKSGTLGFVRSTFGDTTGHFERQQFSFTGKAVNFAMTNSSSTAGFGRLAHMTDAEKTAVALDIRRQYNPNAAPNEVTQKDKEQLGASAGLSRRSMAVTAPVGKQSAVGYFTSTVADTTGGIKRSGLNLTMKGLSFSWLDQRISSGFRRISSLSDFERAQLGNEVGLHRQSMALTMALSKISSFQFNQLAFSDSASGMSRQSFAYQTKGFDARLNLASVDRTFTRMADIAGLTDPERAQLASEVGYKRTELTANLTAIRGLTLNTYTYSARNAAEQLGRDIYRYNLAWNGSKTLKLNFLNEGNGTSQNGKALNGVDHSLLTFEDLFAKSRMKVNGFYDTVTNTVNGVQAPTTTTSFLHFEGGLNKAASLMSEMKRIDYGNGHFENTLQADLNYKASKDLSLHFNHLGIDRGADPSASTNSLQWTWQLNKGLHIGGTYAMTSTNNQSDVAVHALSVGGLVTKNLDFTTTFSETKVQNGNYHREAAFTFANAKPMNVLGLKNAVVSVSYTGLSDQSKLQKEGVVAKLQGMVGKSAIAFEYGGALNPNGTRNQARAFSFTSDRNEKLPYHFDILYKAVNINDGSIQLVRKYNADFRFDKLTHLTYTYNSMPEVNGLPQSTGMSSLALTRTMSKNMNFTLNYGTSFNTVQNSKVNKLAALLAGKTDKFSAVQVGYSVDLSTITGAHTNAHTVSLGYDRKIDADHSLGISTAYTMNGVAGVRNDLTTNVQFNTRF